MPKPSNLTPTQLQDLETFKTTGELGSLENVFIEDCLEELNDHRSKSSSMFNNLLPETVSSFEWFVGNSSFSVIIGGVKEFNWFKLHIPGVKKDIILTLLSRTPEGKAVMSFLDVEIQANRDRHDLIERYKHEPYIYTHFLNGLITNWSSQPATLGHLLYREFTEALRLGKGFDESLKAITKLYVTEFYV